MVKNTWLLVMDGYIRRIKRELTTLVSTAAKHTRAAADITRTSHIYPRMWWTNQQRATQLSGCGRWSVLVINVTEVYKILTFRVWWQAGYIVMTGVSGAKFIALEHSTLSKRYQENWSDTKLAEGNFIAGYSVRSLFGQPCYCVTLYPALFILDAESLQPGNVYCKIVFPCITTMRVNSPWHNDKRWWLYDDPSHWWVCEAIHNGF